MIYYWDYSNYYAIQIRTNRLAQLPFFKLVREIINSIWYDDYNCFICLFCVLPFKLLKIHTVDAYIGLYYCLLVIPTLLAMGLCLGTIGWKCLRYSLEDGYLCWHMWGGMLPRFCMRHR